MKQNSVLHFQQSKLFVQENSKMHRAWLKKGSLLGKSLEKALAHLLVCTSYMLQHF